ncbi:putative T7SS-secreted protein [Rhodococcus opacus]|uniref:putative T7SS-secreted protein n=1 Tax=Rhodococcus opacus TaxID=37919 RepID=UPI00211EC18C|nr:hypothetical protein [Rhodococcus opacus]
MGDHLEVDPSVLIQAAQGITAITESLSGLGTGETASVGRGFSLLALSPMEAGKQEVQTSLEEFAERWSWGVRHLVQSANEIARVLDLAADSYYTTEQVYSDALKTVWTNSVGNPHLSGDEISDRTWGETLADNPINQTLNSWGHTVEAAQARAADAVARWKQAEAEERATKSAYNALTGEQQADHPLVDTWTAMREEAREILRGARADRDGVAGQVSGALTSATATAPTEPPFTERWMNNLTDATDGVHLGVANFYSGLLTGLSGIVQFVRQINPTDTYNMTHPAEYQAGLSNLATGIVVAAADPGTMVSTMVSDIRKNPLEFAGSLTGDAVLTAATGGAGAGVAGARTAVRVLDTAGDLGNGARLLDDVADVSHIPKPDTPHVDSPTPHADTHPTSTDPAPTPEPRSPDLPIPAPPSMPVRIRARTTPLTTPAPKPIARATRTAKAATPSTSRPVNS